MLRPSDIEIWQVLDGRDDRNAKKVADWLSSDEGLVWIENNTDRIMKYCEDTECYVDVPSEEMLEKIHRHIEMTKRKRRLRRLVTAAACAFIPVAFMAVMWMNINNKLGNVLFDDPDKVCEFAALGERKVVVFQDGTKVYLNAGSKLSYPSFWSLADRNVKLEGEGFFQVQKNPKRPFVVDLDGAELKVYGTSFNVKAYPDDDIVGVVLFEGDVVFEVGGKKYNLDPSEQLEYHRNRGTVDIRSLKSPDDQILWTDNVIMFRNNSLREITEILSRWYDVTFEMEDELLYSRTFTLRTDHQPLHFLLEEMEYVSDLHFELDGDVVKVSLKEK